jgi:mono/diheme cytochrome c family protein
VNASKPLGSKWFVFIVLVAFISLSATTVWYKLVRVASQTEFDSADERFKYGSLGAEENAGIPYWIFLVLPRMFPEYLPRPGGYASLGIPWEQGAEIPVGFAKKTVGFPRISNNCAVCHTASYRIEEDANPIYIPTGPGQTTDVQGFFRFLTYAAADQRFNPDNLLFQISQVTELDFIDRLLYRYLIIPIVKKRLMEQSDNFSWMNKPHLPAWLPGRDDPMNLTKYFMLGMKDDGSFGPADMPSIWNLQKYNKGMYLNWDGATPAALSVIIDSALGLGASPQGPFMDNMNWLLVYLGNKPAPKYPFSTDTDLAGKGKTVFDQHCARCHNSSLTGTRVAIDEVQTDRNRLEAWNKKAAIAANKKVMSMGITREPMLEETLNGYIAVHLDGIWLRAPYLHHGVVPTLRDLLEPAHKRPKIFYRGYDVYDPVRVGFIAQGDKAAYYGAKLDVSEPGNGNQGHEYGTTLPEKEKTALLEYLKTL